MCGRYTLRMPSREIAEAFRFEEDLPLKPRFNIDPTQMVAAVRVDPLRNERELSFLKWGLVPFWADMTRPSATG